MNAKAMLLNAAVIGLLASAMAAHADDAPAKSGSAAVGECHGINACKTQGECAGKSNSCKGQNSCKGKGWLKMSKSECTKKHGKFKDMAKM